MGRVNTSVQVRMRRQTGPDYRVRKADVERSMGDKSVLLKIGNERYKIVRSGRALNVLLTD